MNDSPEAGNLDMILWPIRIDARVAHDWQLPAPLESPQADAARNALKRRATFAGEIVGRSSSWCEPGEIRTWINAGLDASEATA